MHASYMCLGAAYTDWSINGGLLSTPEQVTPTPTPARQLTPVRPGDTGNVGIATANHPLIYMQCYTQALTEWDDATPCQVWLQTQPSSQISVYVDADGQHGMIEPFVSSGTTTTATSTPSTRLSITFTPQNWQQGQLFTLVGVTRWQLQTSDVHWCVDVSATQLDGMREYNGAKQQCVMDMQTHHYGNPRISSVTPALIPLLGTNVTLTGQFTPRTQVYVANIRYES